MMGWGVEGTEGLVASSHESIALAGTPEQN